MYHLGFTDWLYLPRLGPWCCMAEANLGCWLEGLNIWKTCYKGRNNQQWSSELESRETDWVDIDWLEWLSKWGAREMLEQEEGQWGTDKCRQGVAALVLPWWTWCGLSGRGTDCHDSLATLRKRAKPEILWGLSGKLFPCHHTVSATRCPGWFRHYL